MAESKGVLLAKSVSKHAGRAKEKLLQTLGKVDRTADEIFDEHLNNFQRQQASAARLQKEFNNYIRCVRAVQTASKSLMESISEVYESQWTGSDALHAQAQAVDVLWQDFSHKLADQVLIPLNTYTAQFPEMKKKIDKRGRKLVDFDSQRHSFQSLQASAAKRKDDVKQNKAREQLTETKRTYDLLNTELHDELPALFDSRILFLVTNLQTLFASEQMFHNETSKIYAELEAIVDKLATESQRGSYTLKKITANANRTSPPQSPLKVIANNNSYPAVVTNGNGNSNANTNGPPSPTSSNSPILEFQKQQQVDKELNNHDVNEKADQLYMNTMEAKSTSAAANGSSAAMNGNNGDVDGIMQDVAANKQAQSDTPTSAIATAFTLSNENSTNANITDTNNHSFNDTTTTTTSSTTPPTTATTTTTGNASTIAAAITPAAAAIKENGNISNRLSNGKNNINNINNNHNNNINNNKMEELYDIPIGATTTDLPPGVLYKVQATYKYVREDSDELSFGVGDVICVIEYEDSEDQEEGWLMGYKENNEEERGMFPANFTRPL